MSVVCTIQAACATCDGRGHLMVSCPVFHTTIGGVLGCPSCGGSGEVEETCEECSGLGEVTLELEDEDLDEYVIDAMHLNRIESAARQAA